MSFGGFNADLGVSDDTLVKSKVGSFQKYHLRRILLRNSLKSLLS